MTQSSPKQPQKKQNPSQGQTDQQLLTMTALLSLYERLRPVGLQELKFITVNELRSLFDYTHAILVKRDQDQFGIETLSGIPEIDGNAPYTLFLKKSLKYASKHNIFDSDSIKTINSSDFNNKILQADWQKFLPNQLLWVGFGKTDYGLILARKDQWSDRDVAVATKIKPSFEHEFLEKKRAEKPLSKSHMVRGFKRIKWLIIIVIIGVLCLPFRQSVLVPAEIIPLKPSLVRSPLEGVIEHINVTPNQTVIKGDPLFRYDKRLLKTQIKASENALMVAKSELRQASQEALSDPKARLRVVKLQGEVKKEQTTLSYTQDLLNRTNVVAPENGVVVFEDVFDWIGRPVTVGERVMLIAQEDDTQLEIRLPVHDTIRFKSDADIRFFSNAAPDKPVSATLYQHSYRASPSDFGDIAYRLKAHWNKKSDSEALRLGLKGSAKIYGTRTPLILHILRRPLIEVRQWMGL